MAPPLSLSLSLSLLRFLVECYLTLLFLPWTGDDYLFVNERTELFPPGSGSGSPVISLPDQEGLKYSVVTIPAGVLWKKINKKKKREEKIKKKKNSS